MKKTEYSRIQLVSRIVLVLFLMLLLPCAVVFQIIRVQFAEGDNLRSLWSAQAIDTISVPAMRGSIHDRKGRVLVTNNVSYSVAVDPLAPGVQRESLREIAGVLEHFTGTSGQHYMRKINGAPRGSRYIVLGRNFDRETYDSLRAHRYRGLILEENYRRRYNFDGLAAHVVGHVNHELHGMMGLEASYDSYLRGADGIQQVRKDSRNQVKQFVGAPRKKPVQGNRLVTTIDAQMQAIVEEELREGVRRARAKGGTAIVVEPQTGRVVAMANYPSFNPNAPGRTPAENRRNPAIADMIEPGSTFKLVTAVAAIEQQAALLDEVFETPENGRLQIHGQWMRDHDPLGTLTFAEAIEKSSNIVMAEVASRIDRDTFYQYARNFGFGTPSSIDLPGEVGGRLQKPYRWSLVTQPWMSVGYEIQVTPLQLAMAYASFANGGNLMRPYLVERIEDENGTIIKENRPSVLRQVITPAAIDSLMPVFQNVVSSQGTAEFASVQGLPVAGKTGTAQKFIDGRYQARYRASFVGFFPADEPKYVTLILLDEPRTSIFGGFMAGPVFRKMTERFMGVDDSMRRYAQRGTKDFPAETSVPHLAGSTLEHATRLLQYKELAFRTEGTGDIVIEQVPGAGERIGNGEPVVLTLAPLNINALSVNSDEEQEADITPLIPDVRGLSMRDALRTLHAAGYKVHRTGSGTVYTQFPEGGAIMQPGRTVAIRGRARPMEQLVSERRQGP